MLFRNGSSSDEGMWVGLTTLSVLLRLLLVDEWGEEPGEGEGEGFGRGGWVRAATSVEGSGGVFLANIAGSV